jgi:hypothetical protein
MLLIRSTAVLLALSSSFATSHKNNKNGNTNNTAEVMSPLTTIPRPAFFEEEEEEAF